MRTTLSCVLLTLACASTGALAQSAATVPTLPKVWTGTYSDTSIGAVSAKNPKHRQHVGEKDEVKGWNRHDGPTTITVLRQEGRHLKLQFGSTNYQPNNAIGMLSEDGKQIQFIYSSKKTAGLYTINGASITGCGYGRGGNGLFSHWLTSYSAWCNEFTTSSAPLAAAPAVPTLSKEWTGRVTATAIGAQNKHQPLHEAHVGADNAAKDYTNYDEVRTLTIIRQEGRHVEALFKSRRSESLFVGTLSADGKQLMFATPTSYLDVSLSEGKMLACSSGRGMDGSFEHWFKNYFAACFDFAAGATPPPEAQAAPILPKEWKGTILVTSEGTTHKDNPRHAEHVGKDKAPTGWNAYVGENRIFTITRQEGRHMELVLKGGPDIKNPVIQRFVGVLSSDGKLLQTTSEAGNFQLNIADKRMSGCGTMRGADGTFEHWSANHNAWCISLAATQ